MLKTQCLFIYIVVTSLIFPYSALAESQPLPYLEAKCPKVSPLVQVDLNQKDEVLFALKELVQKLIHTRNIILGKLKRQDHYHHLKHLDHIII